MCYLSCILLYCSFSAIGQSSSLISMQPSCGVYGSKSNLDCAGKTLLETTDLLKHHYGCNLNSPIDAMDLIVEVKGRESDIFDLLLELFMQYEFRYIPVSLANKVQIGLEGEPQTLKVVLQMIKKRFKVLKLTD